MGSKNDDLRSFVCLFIYLLHHCPHSGSASLKPIIFKMAQRRLEHTNSKSAMPTRKEALGY